jgi:ribonuclease HI
MPLDPRALHIYTDGACLPNPGGPGGAAALAEYPDHLDRDEEQIVDFGCPATTNNRMELIACIKALEWIRADKPWPGVSRVQIISDSGYVVNDLPRADQWKKDDWRNLHGEAKQNSDLWKQLLSARAKAGMRVDFVFQLGKSSSILKRVDAAAKAARDRGGPDSDFGFKGGKVSPSKVNGAAKIFPAEGQTAVIYVYRKSPSLKGENRIRFHVWLEDRQEFASSYYASANDLITADLHRQHAYRVRFNSNRRNPIIEENIGEVFLPKTNSG